MRPERAATAFGYVVGLLVLMLIVVALAGANVALLRWLFW